MPSVLREKDWNQLLQYIRNKQVIPIVGPGLVTVVDEGEELPLTRWLAPRLAEHLELSETAKFTSLNDVASAFLQGGGQSKDLRAGIGLLLEENRFDPPQALLQLAQITDFNLFISTTFDELLGLAVERVRSGFSRKEDVWVYDTNPSKKFPDLLPPSLLCYILGKHDTLIPFPVWDEDYLEYLCALSNQRHNEVLRGLFEQLNLRHLLLLGAPFRDWLVRFFIRVARGRRLSDPRQNETGEYLADQTNNIGEPTIFFFNNVAKATRVIQEDPKVFVAELFERWQKKRDLSGSTQDFLEQLANEIPHGAVFISYSRDDSEAATRLATRLNLGNIPVWLDKQRLHVGGNYERNLQHAVKAHASFFVSLISANTEADATRYVHKERAWAAERYEEGFIFYLPVVIDNTPDNDVKLEPQCFKNIHRDRFVGGEPSEDFIKRLRSYHETWRTSGPPRAF